MTFGVGNERRNEFGLLYYPIIRDIDGGKLVGTAYDRETANLFAAAPELLAFCEKLLAAMHQREAAGYCSADVWLSCKAFTALRDAVGKAKGGRT